MGRSRCCKLLALVSLLCSSAVAGAAPAGAPASAPASVPASAPASVPASGAPASRPAATPAKESKVRYESVVRGVKPMPGSLLFDRQKLRLDVSPSIGEVLSKLPGVAAVRRAASVPEPVFRGLGAERVATTVGGVTLYGACPSRMDPPVSYINGQAVSKALVTQGIPSVTLGPPGLGGRIDVSLDYERPYGAPAEVHAFGVASYDSRRAGGMVGAGVYGGSGPIELRANAQILRLGDYTSGGGVEVPAEHGQTSASLSLAIRPSAQHRFSQALLYRREHDVRYPALPMDNIDTDFWLYNAAYRYDAPEGGLLEQVQLRGGFAFVDHLMTNERKANRKMLEAATPAETRSYAGGLRARWRPAPAMRLVTGADVLLMTRDATRGRLVRASGKRFADHIWPDARQLDAGIYAEADLRLGRALSLRVGLRADLVASEARAADDPSLGGLTIREQYELRYGDDAADTDRLEGLGAAQLLLRYRIRPWLDAHAGAGLSMRAAGITERYFAFGPAPGGFQVGNPSLSPEKKILGEVGLRLRQRYVDARLTGYAFMVQDYIIQEEIQRLDVNGDGKEDSLRGFSNVDTTFLGGELSARIKPHRLISIPLALSYVWGRNTTDGRPLPEIPPLTGRAALRYADEHGETLAWWAEVGLRFAARQGLVDERFPEDSTDAWVDLRVEAGLRLYQRITVRVSVENLLDADYNEHLTREALLSSGALKPGDEIGAPGRGVLLSVMGEI